MSKTKSSKKNTIQIEFVPDAGNEDIAFISEDINVAPTPVTVDSIKADIRSLCDKKTGKLSDKCLKDLYDHRATLIDQTAVATNEINEIERARSRIDKEIKAKISQLAKKLREISEEMPTTAVVLGDAIVSSPKVPHIAQVAWPFATVDTSPPKKSGKKSDSKKSGSKKAK